ncbi:FAD/NAD(P)-binding protein [Streptacidiphilus sp. P02-A3a]|uniref:FAD/NAD(P)-binding protein n=1 Tax=Streptacidiphilus sp. P02-A3a TaxID=2704468 RepID=UPI001CDB5BF5|nr:FAD/NAD(P)-binding protein [Streptacidiphilus sp. P02-A3a]
MTERQVDFQTYVERAAAGGGLVVQPRMGMSDPEEMAAGLRAVAAVRARTAGTITIDSYTRVEDLAGAAAALAAGKPLNGFPIANHDLETTARVIAATDHRIPVQVRHGSARPAHIFEAMVAAGLSASEGGPVSYCLPYSRLPLSESVPAWADAARQFAETAAARGLRAHLETFGGCMLGQMCPPSLLVAISVLEAMFFARCGLTSVSLSYAQQTHAVQDIEALAALHHLAEEYLPAGVARHLVLYSYMGVYPGTEQGAKLLLETSAQIAVRGGASRLIVKTAVEAQRIPTIAENVAALERAATAGMHALTDDCTLPWARQVDYETVYTEASTLIKAVLAGSPDLGLALRKAFADGVLDVPFCLHRDNAGAAQGAIGDDGRLVWAKTGAMPLTASHTGTGTSTGTGTTAVTSARLLGMLRYTAESHDRLTSITGGSTPHRIAIVGSGPRGLAVAERIAARLAKARPERRVEISVIDKVQVGAGRIWRTNQDQSFLMNTACGEVTMFSGPPDAGPTRAGAGPSLGEWWAATDPDFPGPGSYAPRGVYGRYLSFYLDAVESSLPATATLRRVSGEVVAVERDEQDWRLPLADGQVLHADRVVLATGHAVTELSGEQGQLSAFAAAHLGARYIRGDSAADMPLASIAPGSRVAVLGMGLSFYDVVAALTAGRGGRFQEDGRGGLRYLPSGREPKLVAGSRSGVPMPARGLNQKQPDWRYQARLFTPERITELRRHGPLDFRAEVWPWLAAELQLVYHATAVRARSGAEAEGGYLDRVAAAVVAAGVAAAERVARQEAERLGVDGLAPLDVDRLSRPFAGLRFAGPKDFAAALAELLEADIAQARLGNYHGPLKAALDVIRDVRGTLRLAVDYGGLTARSHQRDFLGWFAPLGSFLAAGPPVERLAQTLALMNAGVLEIVGPSVRFAGDADAGAYTASSPQVEGGPQVCPTLIDARIPGVDLVRDPAPLTGQLVRAGLLTSWTNAAGDEPLDTGGVAVTAAPFRPTDLSGAPVAGLYVLGIPTEGQRWFMQLGSTRPGPWTAFTSDADAVAADALTQTADQLPQPALDGGHR